MNGTIEPMHFRAAERQNSNTCTDEELLLEYRTNGSRYAFDELVHRYERELYGYLRHYLGDAEMAEDVFQQTFLQIHLKCDKFEPGRRVRPWLYTVATNQAIDCQRRNRRHRMVSLDRCGGNGADDETGKLAELLDGSDPRPDQAVETVERFEQVRLAVDNLPEQAKQVILLVYFQGMKYREAAEVLSVPVGTVKSRLHAAMRKLTESLNYINFQK